MIGRIANMQSIKCKIVSASVLENNIKTGCVYKTKPGTVGYYDEINNLRVIVNCTMQKGRQLIRECEKWLMANPTASPGNRAAAENVLSDLIDALKEVK